MNEEIGMSPSPSREPVFILAPPRSYSTVTVACLAGHPQIYGFPELLLFSAQTVGDVLVGERRRSRTGVKFPPWNPGEVALRLTGPCRVLAEIHEHNQSPEAVTRAERWLRDRSGWPTERLLDHLLGLVQPRIGLEKSPDTVMSDENLEHCLGAYPQARYVHLTRHPVTAQRSIQEHLALIYPGRSARWRIVGAASMWYLTHLRIARALSAMPRDRWFRLRAEDLLRSPRAWLPLVLRWLRLSYDEEILTEMTHTEQWPFAGTGPAGRLFGGDHKFMLAPQLRPINEPAPVCFDPAWGLLDEMYIRMTGLARYLGYE